MKFFIFIFLLDSSSFFRHLLYFSFKCTFWSDFVFAKRLYRSITIIVLSGIFSELFFCTKHHLSLKNWMPDQNEPESSLYWAVYSLFTRMFNQNQKFVKNQFCSYKEKLTIAFKKVSNIFQNKKNGKRAYMRTWGGERGSTPPPFGLWKSDFFY